MLLVANREPGANLVDLWSLLRFPANRYFSPRVPKQALTRAPNTHGSGLGTARGDCSKGALLRSRDFPARAAPVHAETPSKPSPRAIWQGGVEPSGAGSRAGFGHGAAPWCRHTWLSQPRRS